MAVLEVGVYSRNTDAPTFVLQTLQGAAKESPENQTKGGDGWPETGYSAVE